MDITWTSTGYCFPAYHWTQEIVCPLDIHYWSMDIRTSNGHKLDIQWTPRVIRVGNLQHSLI